MLFAILRKSEGLHMSCGQRLAKAMREKGFRVTAQRAIILETIAHMQGHISAQEVFERASARLPGLNLATVYRTVESLHKADMVDLLSPSGQPKRFALRDAGDPHGHIVCRNCGAASTLNNEAIRHLAARVYDSTGYVLDEHYLTLEGLCPACARKAAGRQNRR